MRLPLSNETPKHSVTYEAIGTRWNIETSILLPGEIVAALLAETQQFDRKWSRFRTDSTVSQLRNSTGTLELTKDEYELWQLYEQLYTQSDGAISPLIGATLEAAGYDADYSLVHRATLPAPTWRDTIAITQKTLTLLRPALIDIGAAGKGLLVDRISRIVATATSSYSIDAGGDMYIAGHGESIALEHPRDTSQAVATIRIENRALCGSAPNRRAWADTHHIVDATTGHPIQGIAAAWATAATTLQADMATTALFVLPRTKVEQLLQCRAIVMTSDDILHCSTHKDMSIYA